MRLPWLVPVLPRWAGSLIAVMERYRVPLIGIPVSPSSASRIWSALSRASRYAGFGRAPARRDGR